jgi:hypothetical protein
MEEKQGCYTTHTFLITSEISSRHICVALTVHAVDITTTKCLTWLSFISVYKWIFLPHSHALSVGSGKENFRKWWHWYNKKDEDIAMKTRPQSTLKIKQSEALIPTLQRKVYYGS